ncbi:unnamed protein product [Symbiodinium necroappetens]|uniref:CS domain-containing protein n=1 Tax=Symbiodinium necroappetens TaxID=1628268 RepID=A0A812WZH0_9DINO|nr:unnamed protein product [Symbiodinium necroappetens]
MAPATPVQEPPLNVREKAGRIVVVFSVPNVRANSVQVESRGPSEDEPAGSVHVFFSSLSPSRSFEKHLILPHGIEEKIIKDVQSKSLTVQLVKLDTAIEWGQAWLKPKSKAKRRTLPDADKENKGGPSPLPTPVLDPKVSNEEVLEGPETAPQAETEVETAVAAMHDDEVRQAEDTENSKGKEEGEQGERGTSKGDELPESGASPVAGGAAATERDPNRHSGPNEAGGKARARRGKKAKSKAGAELDAPEPLRREEDVNKAQATDRREDPKGKKQELAEPKRSCSSPLETKPAKEFKGDKLADLGQLFGNTLEWLKKQQTGLLKDYPIQPPSDPELQQLVSNGTALLKDDLKKATVFLRLAGRKGYLPAYLLLARNAQESKQDGPLIENLCAVLSTPNAKKQLPEGLLNGCAMQLAAVLKDQKNRKEVEVHAEQLDAIAKDWPIVNIVKLQTASEMPSIGSRTKATAKAQQSQRSQRQSDFEQIKAMARPRVPVTPAPPQATQVDVSRGEWREEADAWRFSAQVSELASLSGSQLQVDPSYIRLMDSNQVHRPVFFGSESRQPNLRELARCMSRSRSRSRASKDSRDTSSEPVPVCLASPDVGSEEASRHLDMEPDPAENAILQIFLGLCWCPASDPDATVRLASCLYNFKFEVVVVPSKRPEALAAATSFIEIASKEFSWEPELEESAAFPSEAGDEKSLQDALQALLPRGSGFVCATLPYADRCVVGEQSCLILLSNRQEVWSWLSIFAAWFLGKEPLDLNDEEEAIWLAIELNRHSLSISFQLPAVLVSGEGFAEIAGTDFVARNLGRGEDAGQAVIVFHDVEVVGPKKPSQGESMLLHELD